jgi:hypothetical protein
MYIFKLMSNPPNIIKKREKLQSEGQQQERVHKQDAQGIDMELSTRAESERERSTKKPGTGA